MITKTARAEPTMIGTSLLVPVVSAEHSTAEKLKKQK